MEIRPKITPFLWFDDAAEQAAEFYVSLFEGSRILHVARYGEAGPGPAGSAMMVTFELAGQRLLALNGGPAFTFNEAVSFFVDCEDQAEVDRLWAALTAGGQEQQCGWLKDRYGLSWQIVPRALMEMLGDADAARARRVTEAMLKMVKIDIEGLRRAYEGA